MQRPKAWSDCPAVVSSSAAWVLETKGRKGQPYVCDHVIDADVELLEVKGWIN